jgi:hypothetical protein
LKWFGHERELPFTKSFPALAATAGPRPPYQRMDVERTSIRKEEDRMFRKITLALASVVALGTAALTPATADAHWSGYGWYGKLLGRLWPALLPLRLLRTPLRLLMMPW